MQFQLTLFIDAEKEDIDCENNMEKPANMDNILAESHS